MAAASLAWNCSLATTAYSTSVSLRPACLANSYTCCFCSSAASGVKFGTCQNTSFFARCAGLVRTSHQGDEAMPAAMPAALSACLRVTRLSIDRLPGSSLDRPQREPLDDPSLEDQVHEDRGHGREHGR